MTKLAAEPDCMKPVLMKLGFQKYFAMLYSDSFQRKVRVSLTTADKNSRFIKF